MPVGHQRLVAEQLGDTPADYCERWLVWYISRKQKPAVMPRLQDTWTAQVFAKKNHLRDEPLSPGKSQRVTMWECVAYMKPGA
jgi:hypothetical protein